MLCLCRCSYVVWRTKTIADLSRQAIHTPFNVSQQSDVLFRNKATLLCLWVFRDEPALTMPIRYPNYLSFDQW